MDITFPLSHTAPRQTGGMETDMARRGVQGAKISSWLLAIFGLVVAAVAIGVPLVTGHQEDRAIRRFAQAESERNAQMVFDHLYSVMRKGWTREDIDEILTRINTRGDDVSVALYRGPSVTAQYGQHGQSEAVIAEDEHVRNVFADGADRLIEVGGDLRYLYPLVADTGCLDCHEGRVGDVNGVLDVSFTTAEMRVPLRLTLQSATWIYGAAAALLFLALFALLRGFIVRPIVDLSATMRQIMDSDDLDRRITVKAMWPHEVRLVGNTFNTLMNELAEDRAALLNQSERDPLTGAFNRRRFDAAFAAEISRSARTGRPVAALLIDLDRFKPINDTHGHAAGDAILKAVASVLDARTRHVDVVARVGGDEFAVLAPETSAVEARSLADALTRAIDGLEVLFDGHQLSVGASIGVAAHEPSLGISATSAAATVLAEADEDMYRVKQARRSRSGEKASARGA